MCLGGDGTANTVINELLVKVQKASDVTLEPGCCVIRPSIPVGIIPLGRDIFIYLINSILSCLVKSAGQHS